MNENYEWENLTHYFKIIFLWQKKCLCQEEVWTVACIYISCFWIDTSDFFLIFFIWIRVSVVWRSVHNALYGLQLLSGDGVWKWKAWNPLWKIIGPLQVSNALLTPFKKKYAIVWHQSDETFFLWNNVNKWWSWATRVYLVLFVEKNK